MDEFFFSLACCYCISFFLHCSFRSETNEKASRFGRKHLNKDWVEIYSIQKCGFSMKACSWIKIWRLKNSSAINRKRNDRIAQDSCMWCACFFSLSLSFNTAIDETNSFLKMDSNKNKWMESGRKNENKWHTFCWLNGESLNELSTTIEEKKKQPRRRQRRLTKWISQKSNWKMQLSTN